MAIDEYLWLLSRQKPLEVGEWGYDAPMKVNPVRADSSLLCLCCKKGCKCTDCKSCKDLSLRFYPLHLLGER